MTGEIDLYGNITAIGGLDCKILGGIRAGIKTFLYPKLNANEYAEFKETYISKSPELYDSIRFIEIANIKEVLDIVFV